MNIQELDKFLSENSKKADSLLMHPKTWNGYWSVRAHNRFIGKLFRILGRLLKNKKIYWMGLPVYWETGLKDLGYFDDWGEPTEVEMD